MLREYVTMARQNKVDGIIAITYSNIDEYITSDMAVVSIDRFFRLIQILFLVIIITVVIKGLKF
ncbi:sucrose operon repressor (scr operon regulatory protein) [Streptococcus acidominimus]|uniref:Sucrose operon repressor (Scr operon regulatory protein) n=1 Tax=Streptococcus acidominimus TaxID=1326 RepID=A0A239WDC8_STRAI|nr:hypothetical protein [Streptococcus acidominimus]SNV32199.1 sucrose operon repressor (scr operon regulatory protein) [Streptococcus acidominimus]